MKKVAQNDRTVCQINKWLKLQFEPKYSYTIELYVILNHEIQISAKNICIRVMFFVQKL